MQVFDFDNYDGPLTDADILACKRAGMQAAIVGLQYPTDPQYPPGVAHQQLAALICAGVPIRAVYAESTHIATAWPNVGHLRSYIPKAFVAVEEPHVDRRWIDGHLDYLDALDLGERSGIYTGDWFWHAQEYAHWFGDRDLWAAEYDGNPDPDRFSPFGDWSRCELKQWTGRARVGRLNLDISTDRRLL